MPEKELHRDITDFATCELVEELKKREGVIAHIAMDPHNKVTLTVEGPAIAIVVID